MILERDLGLEDRHRLPDDPDGVHAAVLEFQLYLDASGTVDGMSLDAPE
jgi:hypothetical protein